MVRCRREECSDAVERLLIGLDARRAEIGGVADVAFVDEQLGHFLGLVHVEKISIIVNDPLNCAFIQQSGQRLILGQSSHRSEEHTSELQSLMRISYAVFCLKKKIKQNLQTTYNNQSYKKYVV